MHLHEKASLGTTLWLFQKCIKRLEKPFLSNGPHLVSPQYAQKVPGTHILGAISHYFWTFKMKDPVVLLFSVFSFMEL